MGCNDDSSALGHIKRPNGTSVSTSAVGLLNRYEYQSCNDIDSTSYYDSYLNNGLYWWTLTPASDTEVFSIHMNNNELSDATRLSIGMRPSINLKSNIRVADGNGTIDNPYRLEGDNDTNLEGTYLNERYSGEYIRFGSGENNLYRIVSHENGKETKITSANPLKDNGNFRTMHFGSTVTFSTTNTVGSFLNNDYLNVNNGYLSTDDISMIEDNSTWYLGVVGNSGFSYKLAKYKDDSMSSYAPSMQAKIGLLRIGELMAGEFDIYQNNFTYWELTPTDEERMRVEDHSSFTNNYTPNNNRFAVKPALNLKSNVIITGGDGTKNNPFTLALE